MTKYHKNVDWTNDQERYDFEEEIRMWKARRKEWTWCQTLVWILEIFVLNFLVILALYGGKLDTRNRYPNTSISILKDLSNIGRLHLQTMFILMSIYSMYPMFPFRQLCLLYGYECLD